MFSLPKVPLALKLFPVYLLLVAIFGYQFYSVGANFAERKLRIDQGLKLLQSLESRFSTTPTQEIIIGSPSKIDIPALGITAPIKPGKYDETIKKWQITGGSAFFATITTLPNNQSGNTFIYAHNTKDLFGTTDKLKVGDKVLIYTDNNHIFKYSFNHAEDIKPTDLSIFKYKGKPLLTLLTCTGLFNEKRRLMYFDLEKVI